MNLFLQNAYTSTCEATIHSLTEIDGFTAITLNDTIFFPAGGGQLDDKGFINDYEVTQLKKKDNVVHHFIRLPNQLKLGDIVTCKIDFNRRFDLMQQHTGQHILSQCIFRVLHAETLSFQMKEETSTIQIALTDISDLAAALMEAENLANQIITDNLPITILNIPIQDSLHYNLRKEPLTQHIDEKGQIRIAKIADFEVIPCGGTHCTTTLEVGLIKITDIKKQKDKITIDFLCGQRALKDYQVKSDLLKSITALFNTNLAEVEQRIKKQLLELETLKGNLVQKNKELLSYKAQYAMNSSLALGDDTQLVNQAFNDLTLNDLKLIAKTMIQNQGYIVLLTNNNDFIIAKSPNLALDIQAIFTKISRLLAIKGGGDTNMIQGSTTHLSEFTQQFVQELSNITASSH
ncbi:alanyl-tRNA editing protein [Thiofilum flexile]|uniref:alanyl-tRNA editing protein n=1 Tax=Thiofilum flexile TaxID=125627 RepID=UPI000370EA0B|nr:alanyl-tRNA editing protein [Thiofilum flexile]